MTNEGNNDPQSPVSLLAVASFLTRMLTDPSPSAEDEALADLVVAMDGNMDEVFAIFDGLSVRVGDIRRHVAPLLKFVHRPGSANGSGSSSSHAASSLVDDAKNRTIANLKPGGDDLHGAVAPTRAARGLTPSRLPGDDEFATVIDLLDSFEELPYVVPDLLEALERAGHKPSKVPRRGSRSSATLYLLDAFGRTPEGISHDLLVSAFRRIGVPEDAGAGLMRAVQWELNELKRRGWPIEKPAAGRVRYTGPTRSGLVLS